MGAVPDSKWTTVRLIAEGDLVVSQHVERLIPRHDVRGLATAASKPFSVEHIHVYRLSDGQIVEHWVVRDDLGMMQQIGALAAPG